MPESTAVSLRYDEGRKEFVLELSIKGLRVFESSESSLSETFADLAEQLDGEGI